MFRKNCAVVPGTCTYLTCCYTFKVVLIDSCGYHWFKSIGWYDVMFLVLITADIMFLTHVHVLIIDMGIDIDVLTRCTLFWGRRLTPPALLFFGKVPLDLKKPKTQLYLGLYHMLYDFICCLFWKMKISPLVTPIFWHKNVFTQNSYIDWNVGFLIMSHMSWCIDRKSVV